MVRFKANIDNMRIMLLHFGVATCLLISFALGFRISSRTINTPPDVQGRDSCTKIYCGKRLDRDFHPSEYFEKSQKKISILGSTGSIGRQTLDVIAKNPEKFKVVGLTANSNVELLAKQIRQHRPKVVAIYDSDKLQDLKENLKAIDFELPQIYSGEDGLLEVARFGEADIVVTGIVGCAGLKPTISAIKTGKRIALANKETLIAAGPVILPLLKQYNTELIPADSEHSAIFQCLQGVPKNSVRRLILTASGGAFRDKSKQDLERVTLQDALKHPNWSMGKKITIDSTTLMNKGLEIIEAHFLFGIPYDNIDVVIHPQSIIHSMVELIDTSVLAQLGQPDMRMPLLYAIGFPERIKTDFDPLDFNKIKNLEFRAPNTEMFPCLNFARDAGKIGGTMPAALNAANEQAVSMFLDGQISFLDIQRVVKHILEVHNPLKENLELNDIIQVDAWARRESKHYIDRWSSAR